MMQGKGEGGKGGRGGEKQEDFQSLRLPLPEAQGILGRRGGRSIGAESGQDRALPASYSKWRSPWEWAFWGKSSLDEDCWVYILQWPWQ